MLLLHSISRSLLSRDHSHTSYCGKPTPAFGGTMQYGSLFRLRNRNSCYTVGHTIQARIRNENLRDRNITQTVFHTTDIESQVWPSSIQWWTMFQACQQQWHSSVSIDPAIWWVLIHSTKPHVHTNMLSIPIAFVLQYTMATQSGNESSYDAAISGTSQVMPNPGA